MQSEQSNFEPNFIHRHFPLILSPFVFSPCVFLSCQSDVLVVMDGAEKAAKERKKRRLRKTTKQRKPIPITIRTETQTTYSTKKTNKHQHTHINKQTIHPPRRESPRPGRWWAVRVDPIGGIVPFPLCVLPFVTTILREQSLTTRFLFSPPAYSCLSFVFRDA